MKLTKNEKKVLKLLLDNSRVSDSAIAVQLKISSQAVGKIRRKLESSLIKGYSADLHGPKLGIRTYVFALAKLTEKGMDQGELEVERSLLQNPHIVSVYRIPKGNVTHLIMCAFHNLTEYDDFFHSAKIKREIHRFLEIKEVYAFSHHSVLKNDFSQLLHKAIDTWGEPSPDSEFEELKRFKRRL